jgi:hypothetical protein
VFFANFLQIWKKSSCCNFDSRPKQIICLGLGNFAQAANSSAGVCSRYQLVFLLALKDLLSPDQVLIFDPILHGEQLAFKNGKLLIFKNFFELIF